MTCPSDRGQRKGGEKHDRSRRRLHIRAQLRALRRDTNEADGAQRIQDAGDGRGRHGPPAAWFRVRFQLPGVPEYQHECFQLPVADTDPIKYGFRQGDGRRGKYDTRYNN